MKKDVKNSIWLFIALMANYFDGTFTLYAISMGVEEANPLMRWALDVGPFFFMMMKMTLFTTAAWYLWKNSPRLLPWVSLLYITVVAWHLLWIFKIT
jgi:hypothetical protein